MQNWPFSIYVTALLIAYSTCCVSAVAQESGAHEANKPSMLERVRALDLDSLHCGMTVYYSPSFKKRAQELGLILNEAIQFFDDSLEVKIDVRLALLDRSEWMQLRPIPYGLPYVKGMGGRNPPVAVLPADGGGAVYEFVVALKDDLSDETRQRLEARHYTWEHAARRMVDLIGFHEIGHAYADAYGIGRPALWFNEFIASYFAYAFMHSRRPDMAEIWNLVGHAIIEDYSPRHRTLDEFEQLYFRVGIPDYAWFQSAFEAQANPLVEKHGLTFLRQMKSSFPRGTETLSPEEILATLEDAAPGFKRWATAFKAER